MLHDGSPSSNINSNSLAVDKELTRFARDISRRINQRMTEVQHKADDLDKFTRGVTLRVTSAASTMANLKNHKPVKQVVSTQNIPKGEDLRVNDKRTDMFSSTFLAAYKTAVLNAGQTINLLENPAVFPSSSHYEPPPNGFTNGHSSNGCSTNEHSVNGSIVNGHHHTQSEASSEKDSTETYESDEEASVKNGHYDETPVKHRETSFDDMQPPPIAKKRISSGSRIYEQQIPENPDSTLTPPQSNDSKRLSSPLDIPEEYLPEKTSPVPKVVMRSAAMASVIGEIREKNATKTKFFDSDSDSDTEPLSASHSRPIAAQKPVPKKVSVVEEKLPVSKSRAAQPAPPTSQSAAKPSISTQPPPNLEPPRTAPAQPKLPRKAPVHETKEVHVKKNLFDSDSETDTEFAKPPVKPTSAPVPSVRQMEVAAAAVTKSTTVKTVDSPAPITTTNAPAVVKTTIPAVKPTIGKSLFSSDSDSDDDFLKSFSKTKPVEKPVEKPAAKTVVPAVVTPVAKPVEQPAKKPAETAPKVVNTPATKPPATTTTIIPRKVEAAKKPVSQSLFDDSDSDSDLFSSKSKPKLLIAPKKEVAKKEATPPVVLPEATLPEPMSELMSEPNMEPSSSEQTESAHAKKGPTSEKMSAKISLIAEMQKSFRLPGAVPNIPVKTTSDQEETPQEEEVPVGAILKNRCRGPSNRRPPTRMPK